MSKVILGLGGLLSDAACCVIKNGRIAAAVEQAKIVHHSDRPGSFPDEAFAATLDSAGVKPEEIDCVAIARPLAAGAESAAQLALRDRFPESEIVVVEHHRAHAASAYYATDFKRASVLSVDRAGDFRSAVLFAAEENRLNVSRELYFPDSLGDLYNRVTELLGFEPRADEHKAQWLSTAGQPAYLETFRRIVGHQASGVAPQGWSRFHRAYFDADRLAEGGFSARFFQETGLNSREPLAESAKADLAASLQAAMEETVIAMFGSAEQVAIAGGLAMNALLVQALEARFARVFVQPAAGNAGTALGAALHAWHNYYGATERIPFSTLFLGPEYSPVAIKQVLENCKLRFHYLVTDEELIKNAIRLLNDNKIVAWMQGRMEFGPRALGNRSILASPLNAYSTENLNVYIKHREKFRKFAASVPEEVADTYFKVGSNARYLATVGTVRPAHCETFAAAILAGDRVRVHVVRREDNPRYHKLLHSFGKTTGLPVLYNTSFNLFSDPLVCTPRDAVRSFYSSGVDALFAGSFLLEK